MNDRILERIALLSVIAASRVMIWRYGARISRGNMTGGVTIAGHTNCQPLRNCMTECAENISLERKR